MAISKEKELRSLIKKSGLTPKDVEIMSEHTIGYNLAHRWIKGGSCSASTAWMLKRMAEDKLKGRG